MDKPIFLTEDLHEIGYADVEIDFEVGSVNSDNSATNDFEFESYDAPSDAKAIYINGTEFGGLIEYKKQTSDSDLITYSGYTWRGLLDKWLICPADGEDYYVVSGDLNTIISDILSDVLGGFFTVPSTEFGVSVSSYQFDRYCTVLSGLEKLMEDNGARLYIHADKVGSGEAIQITVEAAEAATVSGYFNNDSDITITYEEDYMGINHLICMGSGELADRMRVDLYADADGNISTTQYYTGLDERQELYDFSNAESEEDLISYGKSRLKDRLSETSLSLAIPDDTYDLEIGDIAIGIAPDGTRTESPITKKVLTITHKKTTITYEV